jgi:hypothetical protein
VRRAADAVPRERFYRWAAALLFIAALAVVLATFADYGITWDEHYHEAYGQYVLDYYLSLGRDTLALTYHNLWLYGGAFDGPVALFKRVSPFGSYESAHLMNALVGLVGVLGAYRIGALLGGARAGFWAALLLLATPSWYGHMFNNPKDIPFAAGMTWTLYFMIRAAPHFPRVPTQITLKLGLALGLTLGVRIAGIFALIYLGAALLVWLALRLREAGLAVSLRDSLRVGFGFVLPSLAVAWTIMLAAWPWAQQNPLVRPFESLRIFSNSPWNLDTLFDGRLVNSLHLPADYLPVYFAVKTPELILVLLAVALALAIAGWRRIGPIPQWPVFASYFMLGFALVFPFAFFVVFRPVSYDGIRHFLFVLPPMAAVAGVVLARLLVTLRDRPLWMRTTFAAVILAYLGWHGRFMVELHPNEYVYYNQIVGGVDGAENRYELDYWGNSYHEAVDRLVDYVADEEAKTGVQRSYRVMVCSSGTSAAYFFPKYFLLSGDDAEADFYISSTRLGCDNEYDGDVIITVERDDAVLSVVKDRRRLRALAPERLARLDHRHVERHHPGLTSDWDLLDFE